MCSMELTKIKYPHPELPNAAVNPAIAILRRIQLGVGGLIFWTKYACCFPKLIHGASLVHQPIGSFSAYCLRLMPRLKNMRDAQSSSNKSSENMLDTSSAFISKKPAAGMVSFGRL